MPFDLLKFRGELTGSGARPNLFQVELTFPASAPDGKGSELVSFMAEASSLPPSNLGTIVVAYFGRELKYPGDRRFPPWSLTVINDENFSVRQAFERWMNSLNAHVQNLRSPVAAIPSGYKVDATIRQYDKIGNEIMSYKMVGAFPTEVSAIDLSWESADSLEKFNVTLMYDWWTNAVTT